uniref:G-protein coupled receptors family 3 profile domain-containing protein n=1 Tax=Eptatretus burgeri TaxID=7764 RepID=A0A8C4PWS2_EPTBU
WMSDFFGQAFSMIFAINEINSNSQLLPNISLGYIIYDDCYDGRRAMLAALRFLQHENILDIESEHTCPLKAVIGPTSSVFSAATTRVLGHFWIPQISDFSSCQCLSNKHEFPAFLRTMPSDVYQARALAYLVRHFGWLYVGAVAADSEYGQSGTVNFLEEIELNGGCVAFHETIDRFIVGSQDAKMIAAVLRLKGYIMTTTKAKVILLFMVRNELHPLAEELLRRNVSLGITWLGPDGWIKDRVISSPRFFHLFQGAIGSNVHYAPIPRLHEYFRRPYEVHERQSEMVDKFILEFWEKTLNCTWNDHDIDFTFKLSNILCANVSADEDDFQMHYQRNTYIAVFAVAHALHDMQECHNASGPFLNGSCADLKKFQPWQLLFYMQKVSFRIFGHTMNFDSNGDPPAFYELISWFPHDSLKIEFLVVGSFNSSAVPRSVCSELCNPGTRKISRKGEPFCCFDCIFCKDGYYSNNAQDCHRCSPNLWSNVQHTACITMPEEYLAFTGPLGIILLSLNVLGITSTIVTGILILSYFKLTPIWTVKGKLIGILLVTLMACFVISVTFFGRPTDLSCQIREPLTCITLSFYVLHLILNNVKLLLLYFCPEMSQVHSNDVNNKKCYDYWISLLAYECLHIACCLVWTIVGPHHVISNTQSHSGVIVLECGGASPIWSTTALTCLILQACVCLVVATKARKLPSVAKDAKFISFSMLCCFLVCLAFLPAYSSTQGMLNGASEIFAISAFSYDLLICIFAPKYAIEGVKRNGDFVVGGMIPLHYGVKLERLSLQREPQFPTCSE